MEKNVAPGRPNNQEDVIDLLELFFELKKHVLIILAAFILGTGIAGAYSYFLITPQYASEAKIYVLSKETTLTSLADLQIGSQLTKDYQVIIGSRPVMQDVIKKLDLDMDYRKLLEKVEITNPKDTRILNLKVTDPDPVLAKEIVDAVATSASDYIGELMEMTPPKLIEDGEISTKKVSPSVAKNALMGGLLAFLAVCAFFTVQFILNDTVKTEEDVEKYLGLPVLAMIPECGDLEQNGALAVRGKNRLRNENRITGKTGKKKLVKKEDRSHE